MTNSMTTCKYIILTSLLFFGILAQNVFSAAGTAGAITLKQSGGARAASMGDSFVAVADDASTLVYNPAGLTNIKGDEVGMMYVRSLLDVSHLYLGYVHNTNRIGAIGFSMFMLQVGEIEIDDRFVKAEEDYVVTFGYAKDLSRYVTFGFSGKWVQSTLMQQYSAGTGTYDFGALIRPNRQVTLGISSQNNGGEIKFIEKGDPLPQITRAGLAYRFNAGKDNNLLLSCDYFSSVEDTPKQNIGFEWVYKNTLAIRFGSKMNYDLDNYTFGMGFLLKTFQLDISNTLMSNMESIQRVSLTLRSMGGAKPGKETARQKPPEKVEQPLPVAAVEKSSITAREIKVDEELSNEVEKDLMPTFTLIKRGDYYNAALELSDLLNYDPNNETWKKIMKKLDKVTDITLGIFAKDKISDITRKGLMSFLKPKENPKDALNKLYYAWESSKDDKVKQLYLMVSNQYPDIAKKQEIPEGFTFVSYKLFHAVEHIYDGKYDLAITESNEVLDVEPENVLALKRLGSSLYCLGTAENKPEIVEKGRAVWRKVMAISPDDKEIKEFLEKK